MIIYGNTGVFFVNKVMQTFFELYLSLELHVQFHSSTICSHIILICLQWRRCKFPCCLEMRLVLFNTVWIYFVNKFLCLQNDSSAQVAASGTLPTVLPMMTSTPNRVFINVYGCYQTSFLINTSYSYYVALENIPTSLKGRFPTHW